ncbi:MAG: ThuA domain-containing protein [Acidobacteriota bacterium]|nr:ThuA domain-containing protein [Acidobacteriota bacterium]
MKSWLCVLFSIASFSQAAPVLKVLIVDGQNNHKWQETTPVLKKELESSGRFSVDVATTPPAGADMSGFQPNFAQYDVILSNYNGDPWPPPAKAAFEQFVRNGGGFVSYHAADNSFPEWKAYNEMIGVGGWGDRTEASGLYVRYKDGQLVKDTSPGPTGHHGKRLPFQVMVRDANHPVTKGLPKVWMHSADELYDHLRGPAENMTVLATAHSDPANSGSGNDEPMLLALKYGKGRVFHTALGHDTEAMKSVDFVVTLLRGTEWAATGKVTGKVPADFPTADQVSVRE